MDQPSGHEYLEKPRRRRRDQGRNPWRGEGGSDTEAR